MNNIIFKRFSSNHVSSVISLLPHQLATVDFLIDRVVEKKYKVLIYHKTGSGKTMIGVSFAILVSRITKVLIILPNQSFVEIWKDHLIQALSLLFPGNFNLDDILFETKTSFIKKVLNEDKTLVFNKVKQYDNYIIIIDEAHNIFDNDVGKTLQKMTEFINLRFVFLSGSPITNTPDKILNIIELIDGKLEDESILDKGKYVYDKQIFKDKLPLIASKIENKVSYFIQNPIDLPKGQIEGFVIYQYPIIPCKMDKIQEKFYYNIVKSEKNMMFSKQVQNVSFAALGNIDYSENSFKTGGKEIKLLDNLTVNDGVFKGKELVELNISSKIKFLVHTIKENPCKRLVYFSNSTVGGLFLKSVLPLHGITEYGTKTVENFLCINCKFKRKCKECFPVKYIIITSREIAINNLNINNIIKVFNDSLNKDGRFLSLIFGSEVIEEGYTLKELKEIIFLTVPDSQAILAQVSGRGIRSWSHSDPKNSTVVIKIFIATTSEDDISKYYEKKKKEFVSLDKTSIDTNIDLNKYLKFKKLLDDDKNKLSFDFRKILYLNLKHHGTKIVHRTLKNASKLYDEPAHEELKNVLIYEFLRQFLFRNNICSGSDNEFIKSFFHNMLNVTFKDIKKLISDTSLTVYNEFFGYSKACVFKDTIIVIPIRLNYGRFLFKSVIVSSTQYENLNYGKKTGNIIILYNKINESYSIKLDEGILNNITTVPKKKLIYIARKYLGVVLDPNLSTKSIINTIIEKCKELNTTSPDIIYFQEI